MRRLTGTDWALRLLLTGMVALLAWAALVFTRGGGPVAGVWLPVGVVLAVLLSRRETPRAMLLPLVVGTCAGCWLGGRSMAVGPLLALANVAELLIGWHLMRRLAIDPFDVNDVRKLVTLWGIGGLVAPAASGVLGAGVLTLLVGQSMVDVWVSWTITHGLGVMIGTPTLFLLIRGWHDRQRLGAGRLGEWFAVMGAVAAGAALLFAQSSYPFLFLAMPLVLLAAFRFGSYGTLVAGSILTAVAWTATLHGRGPLMLAEAELMVRLQLLQLFVWANYVIGFVVSAALAGRDRSRREAEMASSTKSRFLANMSHEIRTPMNAVIGFTELLLSSDLSAEQRRHARLISESGKAMMRLLNDILDLSKIDAGQMTITPDVMDVRHIVTGPVSLMRPLAAQKSLALELSIEPGVPDRVIGDGLRIRQVLLNLIGNALKFTETGGVTVRVRPGADREALLIEVEDSGVGIPVDRRSAVFDEFVQASATTVQSFGGTGLGLAISKRLAGMMGGDLTLESEEGRGTIFRFHFEAPPAGEAMPARAALLADERNIIGLDERARRVLLAEDHDINQQFMLDLLARMEVTADLARNGEEAVDMVRQALAESRPYDLVLMDMQMPVMDGITATRAIRSASIDGLALPIVALSANAYAEDVHACLSAGMQAHLSKPLEVQELKVVLRRWCRSGPVPAAPPVVQPSAGLRTRYQQRRNEALDGVEALAATAHPSDAQVQEVIGHLHKLAGTAAMFGEGAIGDNARTLEEGLARWSPDERADRIRGVLVQMRSAAA